MNLLSRSLALLAAANFIGSTAFAQGNVAQDVAPTTGNAGTTVGTPRGADDGANVIYSNGPYVTSVGGGFGGADASILQNVTLGHTSFGFSANGSGTNAATLFRLADDFTVPDGQMWYVDTVKVYAYRTGVSGPGNSVFTDGVVQVWGGGAPNAGGVVVFGDVAINRLVSATFDNAYRALESTPTDGNRGVIECELKIGKLFKPGTYWVEYGVSDSTAGSTFAPPITIPGVVATGNALQVTASTGVWAALVSGAGTQGMPFTLCGEVACCWEPNLGTNLNHGDDSVTTGLALNFNFPMPGALPGGATTNTVSVSSNGYLSLNNASGSDFTPSVSEFTSLQPRIAVPWDDYYTPGGGSVWFSSTPFRATATWLRIDTFDTNNVISQSMLQLQMFPDGSFTINTWYHEPVTLRTPVFGVSAGSSAPSVAINYTAGHVGVPGTATIYEGFTSGTSDLSGNMFCFTPVNDGFGASYDVTVTPACCTFAVSAPVGPGCFGMTTVVTQNAIAGGTAILTSTLPGGTIGQVTLLGLFGAPNLFDLGGLGAPSCFLHHTNDLGTVPMDGAGVTTLGIPCLASIMGFPLQTQGVAIVPALNPLNVAVGDAWSLTIGNN